MPTDLRVHKMSRRGGNYGSFAICGNLEARHGIGTRDAEYMVTCGECLLRMNYPHLYEWDDRGRMVEINREHT